MEPKQIVYDFLANRMEYREFKKYCQYHPEVLDWVQSVVPDDFKGNKLVENIEVRKKLQEKLQEMKNGVRGDPAELMTLFKRRYDVVEIPYSIIEIFDRETNRHGDEIGQWLNIHSELANIIKRAFPDENIEISDYAHNLFDFVIDTCPEYIGGPEVDASNILLDIYNRLPPGTETARKKEFKSQIKALFRCKGAKRPRWIQEAEWPMGKNSPMVFVSQSHSADVYSYVFEDADTGEKRTITQLA